MAAPITTGTMPSLEIFNVMCAFSVVMPLGPSGMEHL